MHISEWKNIYAHIHKSIQKYTLECFRNTFANIYLHASAYAISGYADKIILGMYDMDSM